MATTDLLATTARYYRERGWRKVALITSTDASGQDGERQVNAAFSTPENKNMEIVDREHFNTSDISVAAQMTHIKQSGAQAMIAWMTGSSFATILHGAQDAGLTIRSRPRPGICSTSSSRATTRSSGTTCSSRQRPVTRSRSCRRVRSTTR
jgi:ABC-type branched-subunit amino acid transport system substrate-binding protein